MKMIILYLITGGGIQRKEINMATKKEKEEIRKIFIRTIGNCCWYEKENKTISLVNEIGVLRGVGYAMESIGLCPHVDMHFMYFIDLQQKLKGKKEVNK